MNDQLGIFHLLDITIGSLSDLQQLHDLGTLECHLVVFNDNTETSIEIAADGSAAVIVNPVGKPAAKAAAKPTSRKGKAAAKIQKAAEPQPEPETQEENPADAPEPYPNEDPAADDDTQVNLDQTEVPGATRLEEPAAEAPAPQPVSKSVFGSKVKNIQEDAPAQTEAEAAPAAQAETPRPVGASIFSKVGKAS